MEVGYENEGKILRCLKTVFCYCKKKNNNHIITLKGKLIFE